MNVSTHDFLPMPMGQGPTNGIDLVEMIVHRWPEAVASEVAALADDRAALVAYLAKRHDLTVDEAAEEVDDFLFTLHRRAA